MWCLGRKTESIESKQQEQGGEFSTVKCHKLKPNPWFIGGKSVDAEVTSVVLHAEEYLLIFQI